MAFATRSVNVRGMLLLLFVAGAALATAGFMRVSEDAQLALRMVLALAIAAAITIGVVFACALALRTDWWFFVPIGIGFTALGFAASGSEERTWGRPATEADQLRIEAALQRLALVAAIVPPDAVVEPKLAPLSWTISAPGGRGAVHVTTGLLDRLVGRQLQAVAAHELSHLMHRDATVMTLVAGWPAAYMHMFNESFEHDSMRWELARNAGFTWVWLLPIAFAQLCAARLLSRQRELVADRTAAHLIGSAAAVSDALITLSDGMRELRDSDLRDAKARDLFYFLPTEQPSWTPWATHPPLEERLACLARMERDMQRQFPERGALG